MDDKCMPCRPSRSVRPPPRPQGVFDLTQARLATNFRRRSIPPRVILYEPRTPDLTQSHECKHTWDSRVGVWHGVLTSCGGLPPATSRRPTLLLLGCVLLLRLGTLLLLRLGTLLLLRLGTLLLLLLGGLLLLLLGSLLLLLLLTNLCSRRTFPTELTS